MSSNTVWVHHLGGSVEYVDGDLYRTRCLSSGDDGKPPLLFLHGIGGHVESFIKNVRVLGEEFSDRSVYALDFIGHGFSDVPDDTEFSLSDYVDQVAGFIHAIGHEEAHVFGESLGGAVATRMALDRPGLVRTLGQITPAGLRDLETEEVSDAVQEESDEGSHDLFNRTMEMLEAGVTRETVYDRLDWLFVDDPDEELVDVRHEIYQRDPVQDAMPAIYEAAFVEGYDYYTMEELRSLRTPTLLVHTEHNPSSKKEQAAVAHNLMPESEYHVFDHSGHWPQYEEPERFNELVVEFIRTTE